jgi:drug/metabolite transporter (DMT)-like permease
LGRPRVFVRRTPRNVGSALCSRFTRSADLTLLLLGLAQAAIGAAAIFARFALTAAGPLSVAALRLAIAAALVVAVASFRRGYRAFDVATERRLVIAGVMLALHFATWIASLRYASVAVSTLLVCTTPVFTEIWSMLRMRRVDARALMGAGLALLGVALVVGLPGRYETPLGIGLALGGAVAMAAYLLLVRASDPRYDTGAVAAIAAVLAHDTLPPRGATVAWGGILAMALGSQLFGHTVLNAAVRTLSPTFVATTTLLEPLIAALAAAVVFGERLAPATWAGAAAILVAIAVSRASTSRAPETSAPRSAR